MEFRDRFRRGDRRQADAPVAGAPADGTPAAAPGPGPSEDDGRPMSRDADWDGGWRRVAPPAVTVARSSIGVSDGLRFRSRLASWQNIAYGGELGHAVLPSAPVGLIHGVTRPGAARTSDPGTPLLLRAAGGAQEEPEPVRPPVAAATGRPPVAQRTLSAVQRSGGTRPRSAAGQETAGRQPGPAGATGRTGTGPATGTDARPPATQGPGASASTGPTAPLTRPAPVRPRRTAPPLIVARRPVTHPRHLTAFAPAATASPAATPSPSEAPSADRPAGSVEASREPGRAGTGERLPTVRPERSASTPATPPVRPALGKPLRQLPSDAVPFARPGGVAGPAPSGPAAPPDPALPVVQRQTPETAAPASPAAPAGPSAGRAATGRAATERPATEPQRPVPGACATRLSRRLDRAGRAVR
ncbi:hypothetical protein [Streptomyces sp. OR43]|uniref:hypothetical protein n=1 Tax=Streptomyces sp. or43 TaxID=2478957 RepID=UPI0011CD3CB9|nr:hypothetical protein [Streptomyces sp. or43]TXS42898.1 hypothetical protein EAO72_12710 [Streptomyces sp. or43]